jgi:integrase
MKSQTMVHLVEEYLSYRHKLGFQVKIEGQELLRFAHFADQANHHSPLTADLAIRWAALPQKSDSIYRARRLDIVRRFAKYRALFDPATEILPEKIFGPSYRRSPPHIYSDKEIADLLLAASNLGSPNGLRRHTYRTLFGLLVCTGLRISEALKLKREDVDLNGAILNIKATKFKKTRLVPLHESAVKALRDYSQRRDRYHPCPKSNAFFLTEKGTPLKYWRTLMTFLSLSNQLGWRRPGQQRPPKIHDMRHSFAVKRLLLWYQEGANVDQKIAYLSTYLGHAKVTDTYWYFSAVPELLSVVARRFEHFAKETREAEL